MMSTNQKIKRFQLDFIVKDAGDWMKQEEHFISLLVTDMREQGYIPVMDLSRHVASLYNAEKDYMDYTITMHGIYKGKRRSWDMIGLIGDRVLQQPTQKSKSKESCDPSESE